MSNMNVRLTRPDSGKPWGFRLQGGSDFRSPLIIQRVNVGGIASQRGLCAGDRVIAISGDSTENFTHQQAQQAVIRAGNELDMVVRRGDPVNPAAAYTMPLSINTNPMNAPQATYTSSPRSIRGQFGTTFETAGAVAWPNNQVAPSNPARSQSNAHYNAALQNVQPPALYNSPPAQSVGHAGGPLSPANARAIANAAAQRVCNAAGLDVAKSSGSPAGQRATVTSTYPTVASYPSPNSPRAVPSGNVPNYSSQHNRATFPIGAAKPGPAGPSSSGGGQRHGTSIDVARHMPNSMASVPVCHRCQTTIRGPFLVALDRVFCPSHFQCSVCNCDLEHTGFVEDRDRLYCEADFRQYLAPLCGKCNQPVVGTAVKALGRDWHTQCFTCAHCRRCIGGGGDFHIEDGQPYCNADWQELFQTRCDSCGFPIEATDKFLEAFDKTFHAACFVCNVCKVSLEGKPFFAKEGRPYCKGHARAAARY